MPAGANRPACRGTPIDIGQLFLDSRRFHKGAIAMKPAVFLGLGLFFGIGLSAAVAADLPQGYPETAGPAFCGAGPDLSPASYIPAEEAVNEHLALAEQVSQSPRAIYNSSPLLVWANETVNYCGFAVGYFKTGEFNQQTIMQCECFYSLMRHYMVRSGYDR